MLLWLGHPASIVVLALLAAACTGGGAPGAARPETAGAASEGPAAPAAAPVREAPTAAPVAAAPPLTTIKIAAQPSIPSAARYIAIERGYLREEGIEQEEVPSDTSARM